MLIRGSASYTSAYLLEINANAVHSKYFGESSKEIVKAFANIFTLADDPQTMVCVLVDEVETITTSRKHAHDSHEVGDALRATKTNQLLTALDKARSFPNVLLLCTSNLVDVLDLAFLSRVDIDEHIGSPSPQAAACDILSYCTADII
jgi:SpoVK/Ycf46/Vps4 family AAA+-type ATPase